MVFDVDAQKSLTKADRLIYGESSMTHAMVFTGVSLDVNINNIIVLLILIYHKF